MVSIVFMDHAGVERRVEARPGMSLMEAAKRNGVEGVVAECGGSCACATCHVHVDPAWFDRLPPREAMEADMLEFASDTDETSRLSCQIKLTEALDGLTVRTPEQQG